MEQPAPGFHKFLFASTNEKGDRSLFDDSVVPWNRKPNVDIRSSLKIIKTENNEKIDWNIDKIIKLKSLFEYTIEIFPSECVYTGCLTKTLVLPILVKVVDSFLISNGI